MTMIFPYWIGRGPGSKQPRLLLPRVESKHLLLGDGGGEKEAGTINGSITTLKIVRKEPTFGTWNVVRTLNALGKFEHEMRRYRWSILGLSEVSWTCIGETTTGDGRTLWYSGKESYHQKGVGFLVHKDVAKSVLECRPISSRIITLRLSGQLFNITVIQVYAPTTAASDLEMNRFYKGLHEVM
ncbi:putative craniofacial development protein 2-like [Apostichopus japonicus]|uniref:Putative craniofacial development protein 2-like n=1 Tax=Stichopus japonicus TaxID=307972 RepID=A0A2G8KNK3_STIJA|nr:putative craniofacial development protein 2-like [Apostichopus japonicus]